MTDDELIRPHDPFSGHEAPAPAKDTTEPPKPAEEQPPPPEPVEKKAPARRTRRPRRTPPPAKAVRTESARRKSSGK
jgi:hypothetical protein